MLTLRIISVRNYQKLDKDKLDEIFKCDDVWDDALSRFDDLSDCPECFNLIINGLLDLLVPLKNLRVRQRDCPWLSNASLTNARRLHDIVHRKALKSGCLLDWSSYRSLRNKVNSMLRSAKAKYFENLSSSLLPSFGDIFDHCQGAANLQMVYKFLLLLMCSMSTFYQFHTKQLLL